MLPPAQSSTNLQPQRSPIDPNAALQAQKAQQEAQQEQMMKMIMALIMHAMQGQVGTGGEVPGMGDPAAAPPQPFGGASASPTAPPVPAPGANGGM